MNFGRIAGIAGVAATAVALFGVPGVTNAAQADAGGCAKACHRVFVEKLPHGGTIEGVRGQDAKGLPVSAAVYRLHGQVRGSIPLSAPGTGDGAIDFLEKGHCFRAGAADNCLFLGAAGAHAEGAILAHVSEDTGFVLSSVQGGAPGGAIADLDRNGTPDIVLRNSTYDPDYASAPQYWTTYRNAGGKLRLTGCSAPSKHLGKRPSTLLHGSCAG